MIEVGLLEEVIAKCKNCNNQIIDVEVGELTAYCDFCECEVFIVR